MEKAEDFFQFPYAAYPQQVSLMQELYNVLENKKIGIFESPTGTGKSLSVLCGCLTWLINNQNTKLQQLKEIKQRLSNIDEEVKNETDWVKLFDKKKKLENEMSENIHEIEDQKKILDFIENVKRKKMMYRSEIVSKSAEYSSDMNESVDNIDDNLLVNYDSDDETMDPFTTESSEKSVSLTKIYYCSRTYSQLSQILVELCKTSFADKIVVSFLGSRQNLCVNNLVSRLKSVSLMNEKCLDLQRCDKQPIENQEPLMKRRKSVSRYCKYKSSAIVGMLQEKIVEKPMDIEDLTSEAMKIGGCPFYAVRRVQSKAHLILMPYQNMLNPNARMASEIDLTNNVVIIDEAHNLADTISTVNSVILSLADIKCCQLQINAYLDKYINLMSRKNILNVRRIISILDNLQMYINSSVFDNKQQFSLNCTDFVFKSYIDNFRLGEILKFIDCSKLAYKLRQFCRLSQETKSNMMPSDRLFNTKFSLTEEYPENQHESNELLLNNPLLIVKNFLAAVYQSLDAVILVVPKESLTFLVVAPGLYLKDIVDKCRSVVVIGGTMQPFCDFTDRLFKLTGCSDERIQLFSCDHIVDASKQLRLMTLKNDLDGRELRFTHQESQSKSWKNVRQALLYQRYQA